MILVTALFLLLLVLIALCLYVSGVFNNRRAFQFGFSILLVFFALTIGIGTQHFYEDYDCPATNPLNSAMGLQWRPSRALQMEVPGFFGISFETL